ncbi:MAG: cyclic nucleotide-binding domain-containing protein [Thermodesulfobacteriota bacterium]
MADLASQEALLDQYISENKTEEALKLLFDLIVAHAKEKNFEKAEALHERLYDVDPMALTEIVRAGEIIEEAKSESLDKEHLEIWADLYENLSAAEGNALYYSMKPREFEAGEPIVEQGAIDNRLYFINKGEVKAVFRKEDKEKLLLTLGVGDIFGQDQFFSATVSTVSLIPLSRVKVTCLESDVLKKWKNDTPALESKLFDYCRYRDKIKQTLGAKGMERREYTRTPLSGKMVFHLLDGANKSMGKAYKGEISDISAGGLSFLIKTSKPETIRMLLGRRLQVKFDLVLKDGQRRTVDQPGHVIAVQSQAFDDFSIHLKLDTPLDQSLIEAITQGD